MLKLMQLLIASIVCLGSGVTTASAFAVYGAIGDKWRQLGGEAGVLGPALSDEADAPGGGRFNRFAAGFIYWKPQLGAFAVYGSIGVKWTELGGPVGYGYPVTDERPADRGGRYNDFERGNSIYWHPNHGTHAVYGAIREKWRSVGAEKSFMGYPVTDEMPAPDLGRFSAFAGGLIYWRRDVGAHLIYGEIGKKWLALGGPKSPCGYPTTDEADFDDGRDGSRYGYGVGSRFRRSGFQNGQILWSKARNEVYVECTAGASAASPRPPATEACAFTAVAANAACINADGTPSSLTPGGTTANGCGGTPANAQARAKAVLGAALCLSDGNSPQPGCCTYTVRTAQGCGC